MLLSKRSHVRSDTARTQSQGDVCAILSASDRSGYHQSALAARAPGECWCNENDDERRIFQRGDVIHKNIVSFEIQFWHSGFGEPL